MWDSLASKEEPFGDDVNDQMSLASAGNHMYGAACQGDLGNPMQARARAGMHTAWIPHGCVLHALSAGMIGAGSQGVPDSV